MPAASIRKFLLRWPSALLWIVPLFTMLAFAFLHGESRIEIEPRQLTLPADGREHLALRLQAASSLFGSGSLTASRISSTGPPLRLIQSSPAMVEGLLLAPVNPGGSELRLRWRNQSFRLPLTFVFDPTDTYQDGTPDFLRLHSVADRQAFRDWFTAIAEGEANQLPEKVPAEIDDCAALLRFSYREALRAHDERWFQGNRAEAISSMSSIRQYHYPQTPLGAALFRVTPGPFLPGDLSQGGFAQFADARTLMEHNTYFLSRRLAAARAGDLIFYRLLEQNSSYHSMIVVGDHADRVVYHTGPIGHAKGEIRRVSISDLLHYPDARWRPVPENSNFLGVYRWNILRDAD